MLQASNGFKVKMVDFSGQSAIGLPMGQGKCGTGKTNGGVHRLAHFQSLKK